MNNQIIIIVLISLLCLSAFFSSAETAFASVNEIRLKYLANNGNKRAALTLKLLDNYTALLSSILIGNNIVNIFAASLATLFIVNLFGNQSITYSSLIMSIIILLFGEITPKTLAKERPETWSMAITPFFVVFVWLLKPFNFFFNRWELLLKKIFNSSASDALRSEEFITLVEEAQEGGNLNDEEADLLTNAIEFKDNDVREILTPRVDVVAAEVKTDYHIIEKLFRANGFSRLPIYEGTIDNIIGVLLEKDFYYLFYNKKKHSLKEIIKPVIYTSPHMKIAALLKQLQSQKMHMAVVIDEYGGTAGIITMEDILEELVGEIYDEHDKIVEYYQRISANEYLIKGDADIEDVFDYFDINNNNEDYDFNTVSAWVIYNLDKMPTVGDSFIFNDIKVLVSSADSKKVLAVKFIFLKDEPFSEIK